MCVTRAMVVLGHYYWGGYGSRWGVSKGAGVWGHVAPENVLDSRSSEMGSSAI